MRTFYLFATLLFCSVASADNKGLWALWPDKMTLTASAGNNLYPVSGEWIYNTTTIDNDRSLDAQYWSRGLGWTQRVRAEMILNDWLQWSVGYMHVRNQMNREYTTTSTQNGGSELLWAASGLHQSEMHAFELGAKIRKDLDYWTILFGMDVVLPAGVSVNEVEQTQLLNSSSLDEWEYRGGRIFGMNHSLTVKRPITETIAVYAQCNVNWTTYAPERKVLVRSELDGQSVLQDLPVSSKEFYFSNSYTMNTANPDPNSHSYLLQEELSFGALGFGIGVEVVIMD